MTASDLIAQILSEINLIWLILAIITAFGIGAVWYSLLFFKMWTRVFHVSKKAQEALPMARSFIVQFLSGVLLSIAFFILARLSLGLAVLSLTAFAGLQMCALSFKYENAKTFLQASMIEAGYTLVAGAVYISFSMI